MRQGITYSATTGAEQGVLARSLVTILFATHEAIGTLDSCSRRVVIGRPELLVYLNPTFSLFWIQHIHFSLPWIQHIHVFSSHRVHYFHCAQAILPRRWRLSLTDRTRRMTIRFLTAACILPAICRPRRPTIQHLDNHLSPIGTSPQTLFHRFKVFAMRGCGVDRV
jgi:hypothetical protein